MNVLLIGGTGLISTGIIKHLLHRGVKVTMFNRGQRANRLDGPVETIIGDRNDPAQFSNGTNGRRWDCVIDMICFTPEQAQASVNTFAGKCEHFVFCSTVCTYGIKIPPGVIVDETFAQEPISNYGKNKVACEKIILDAHAKGDFPATIIRPSHTYGEGNPLIDQLEFDPCTWDRIEKGLPVLCAGDGLGLWNATHRDDVGKLFAYTCGNTKTFGQAYNATTERVFTWRDYYREAGMALGKEAKLMMMPASWIISQDPKRFGLLHEITQFHGPYTSAKARRDVPEFVCDVAFTDGAARVFADQKKRGAWKVDDAAYQRMVDKAAMEGIVPARA